MRQYFPILKERVRAREFNSLFLFVTSRCNSLCRTSFYFDKLNSPDDLTTAQIERISATAPPFRKLWLSGGEPFLRENLAEIVALFVERKGVRNVNLPTNRLLPEKIFRIVDRMLELCPEVAIDLNFSLDGLANTHDSIRGVPHNFVRTLATIEQAERRYGGVRRLRRNVLTVIMRENYNEIVALGLHLMEQSHIGQYFEVVRGAAHDFEILPDMRLLHQVQAQRHNLVVVLAHDHRQHVAPQPPHAAIAPLRLFDGGQRADEIMRHAADRIVRVGEAIERKVQVDGHLRTKLQHSVHDAEDLLGQQSVGRQIDVADPFALDEQRHDFGQILAQEGLAAGQPQFAERRSGGRDALDLRRREVVRAVKLVKIEAGAAERIATRSDKQKKRVELPRAHAFLEDREILPH